MSARDIFILPIDLRNEMRIERARPIAAAAKESNRPPCRCENCIQIDKLESVQRAIRQI